MKRTLTTGLTSAMDYLDDDGNLTSDGLWDYTRDADGARQRVDGAPQCGVPGAKRRVRKTGAHRATDEQNRLTAMTMKSGLPTGMIRKRLEFVYDYLGRRVEKKVLNSWTDPTGTQTTGSGTTVTHLRYVYDGHNLIAELNGSNNTVLSTYVWGLDLSGTVWGAEGVGGLLMVREGSKTYFPAYDGNGNVSALLDSADGSLDAKYEYGAFGETLRVSGTAIADDNPFRFSTKYTDTESGLVYYGFRYYSPSLGRFLNRDPLGEAGGSNLYGFVENDPVNGWDYLGLTDWMGGTCADYEAVFGFSCLSLSPWEVPAPQRHLLDPFLDSFEYFIVEFANLEIGKPEQPLQEVGPTDETEQGDEPYRFERWIIGTKEALLAELELHRRFWVGFQLELQDTPFGIVEDTYTIIRHPIQTADGFLEYVVVIIDDPIAYGKESLNALYQMLQSPEGERACIFSHYFCWCSFAKSRACCPKETRENR